MSFTDNALQNADDKSLEADPIHQDEARDQFTYKESRTLLNKADFRILPILICLYLSKGMDTSLTSYLTTLNSGEPTNILNHLGITTNQYGFASTAYYVTYIIFEIPSNLIIKWSTPRLHFTRITLFWSIVAMCTAGSRNLAGFLTARAFLGMAEAGLLPGMFWHLTCWYRPDEIAIRVNILAVLNGFSGIFDALLTFGLSFIDGRGGLAAWQWAYLIVGLMGLPLSVWVYFAYPDFPDSPPSRRQFLTQDEGAFLTARLPSNSARSTDINVSWHDVKRELRTPSFYLFPLFNLCMASSSFGISFWLPTILSSFGLTSGAKTQLLNIPTAVAFIVFTLSTAYFLDHDTRVPRPLIIYTAALGMMGMLIGMIFCRSSVGLYLLIICAQACYAVMIAPIWPWRSQTLRGSTSASFALAVQNTAGQLPGLYTAQFFQSQYAPRYAVSYSVCIAFAVGLVTVTSLLWYLTYDAEKETRRIARLRHHAGKDDIVIKEDVII